MTEELPQDSGTDRPYGWPDVARDMQEQGWHPDLQAHAMRHLDANGVTPYSGRDVVADEAAEQVAELPTRLGRENIRPHAIGAGNTELVLQRHGKYVRNAEDERVGSLTTEAQEAERTAAEAYFETFLSQIPADELKDVHVLFVASDTNFNGGGQRSYETAMVAQGVAQRIFKERRIDVANILNISHDLRGDGRPRPMPVLREPQMFSKSPDFVEFLKEKYGDQDKEFWVAFEEDTEKETRESMRAEGPDEIADRTNFSVRVLSRYASMFHVANPGKRLVIWADTHYDTISPFVKRDVLGVGKEAMLLVDYGAGVTIDIDSEGNGYTELGGRVYPVPTHK